MPKAAHQIVVSLDSLEEQIRERQRLLLGISEAQERVRLQERKLQAMADLLGVDWTKLNVSPDPAPPIVGVPSVPAKAVAKKAATPRAAHGTWNEAILSILREANRGLAHAALYKALEATEFAKTVNFNQKRYYTTISRMQKKKQVVRIGSLTYAPDVAKKLAKSGPVPTEDLEQPQFFNSKIQTPTLIKRLLRENPKGLQGNDLIGMLSMMDDAPESVRSHPQFVYTTLSKMIRSGAVKREEGVYRLTEGGDDPAVSPAGSLH